MDYKFASDIDPKNVSTILSQKEVPLPRRVFGDLTKRDHRGLPKLDVYVAGFPCQPFSLLGKREAHNDKRAGVLDHIIETIVCCNPKIIVLENVSNLINDSSMYSGYTSKICKLRDKYTISEGVLNSTDYGSVQIRNRYYLLGVRKDLIKCNGIRWPPKRKRSPGNFESHLEESVIEEPFRGSLKTLNSSLNKIKERGGSPRKENWVFPTTVSEGWIQIPDRPDRVPTMTRTHTHDLWVTSRNRFITPEEALSIQGFPSTFIRHPSSSVTYAQVGNSMSIHTVRAVLEEGLRAIGK